jgi:hypothetical protein
VLSYDVGKGLRLLAGNDPARLRTMAQWLTERLGNASTWPRDPDAAIAALDALLERNLIDPPDQRKRIAVVLDYASYLVPAGETGSRSAAARLVRILGWATNPLLRRVNVAVVLVAENLTEVHPRDRRADARSCRTGTVCPGHSGGGRHAGCPRCGGAADGGDLRRPHA